MMYFPPDVINSIGMHLFQEYIIIGKTQYITQHPGNDVKNNMFMFTVEHEDFNDICFDDTIAVWHIKWKTYDQ